MKDFRKVSRPSNVDMQFDNLLHELNYPRGGGGGQEQGVMVPTFFSIAEVILH